MTNLNIKNSAIIPTLFKAYWELGNYDLQTAYLLGKSESKPTAAQSKLGDNNKKRCHAITIYWVTFEHVKHPVCRIAFANIHGLTTERVEYLNRKKKKYYRYAR